MIIFRYQNVKYISVSPAIPFRYRPHCGGSGPWNSDIYVIFWYWLKNSILPEPPNA